MLKKVITYEDPFTEETVTETLYFNLTTAELVELEVGKSGGLGEHLKRIVDSGDGAKIMAEFKNLMLMAYGVRSEDGKRFLKNDRIREEFQGTEAYSVVFTELVTNAEIAAKFINAIMPKNLNNEIEKIKAAQQPQLDTAQTTETEIDRSQQLAQGGSANGDEAARVLTSAEAQEMDAHELQSGLADGRYKLS